MDLYSYIINIDNTRKFYYTVIIAMSILFVKRLTLQSDLILNFRSVLTGLVIGSLIVYFINERETRSGADFIGSMMSKLEQPILKKTKYLYTDSELLQFLDDIKQYHNYNPANYRLLVLSIDNFLKISTELERGVVNMGELYDLLINQKYKILNTFHSMIYSVPHSHVTMKVFHEAMASLEKLLNIHVDQTYQYVGYSYGKKPIDINTKFIYKNHPLPHDSQINNHYNYF